MDSHVILLESNRRDYAGRTEENAQSADLTIAFATDFTTAGERLTSRVAGHKYLAVPLDWDDDRAIRHICKEMFVKSAKKLNIAGNGIYTLSKKGITQEEVNDQIYSILSKVNEKYPIESIRSGGQTGVDMAGLVAGICLNVPTTGLFPRGFRQRDEKGEDYIHDMMEIAHTLLSQSRSIRPELEQLYIQDRTLSVF